MNFLPWKFRCNKVLWGYMRASQDQIAPDRSSSVQGCCCLVLPPCSNQGELQAPSPGASPGAGRGHGLVPIPMWPGELSSLSRDAACQPHGDPNPYTTGRQRPHWAGTALLVTCIGSWPDFHAGGMQQSLLLGELYRPMGIRMGPDPHVEGRQLSMQLAYLPAASGLSQSAAGPLLPELTGSKLLPISIYMGTTTQ